MMVGILIIVQVNLNRFSLGILVFQNRNVLALFLELIRIVVCLLGWIVFDPLDGNENFLEVIVFGYEKHHCI